MRNPDLTTSQVSSYNFGRLVDLRKLLPAILIVSLLILLLVPRVLYGKDTGLMGFNNQLFKPQVDGYGLYNTSSSKVLPHLNYSFGLYTNFSNDLMSVVMPARRSSIKAIENNFTGDFNAALGLFDFIDVGFDVPVAFYEGGTNYNDLQGYKTAAIGDVRFDTKFRLLKNKPDSIGIALMSSASFPTGSRANFTGDKWLTWEGRLIVNKSFRPVSLFANVGYRFLKSVRVLSTVIDDEITFGGGLLVPLPVGDRSWSVLAEISGKTIARDIRKISTPVEVLGGLRKEFDSGLTINFGGGGGIVDAYGASDFRLFAGISFNLAKRREAMQRRLKTKGMGEIEHIVYFGFNKSNIEQRDYPKLREIGQVLAWDPEAILFVNGYTDNTGSRAYNVSLGYRRAQEVMKYLIYFGAYSDKIKVNSYGEERPAAPNDTAAGRRKNRRVEVHSEQK